MERHISFCCNEGIVGANKPSSKDTKIKVHIMQIQAGSIDVAMQEEETFTNIQIRMGGK
jgi:hypothetical protein